MKILSSQGARIVLGDVNVDAAEKLAKEYSGVTFVKCDVTKYDDLYNLFKTAYDTFGQVDHAVSCAGIFGAYNVVLFQSTG